MMPRDASESQSSGKSVKLFPVYSTNLNPNDVLLGRGAPLVKYEGNIRFRRLVLEKKPLYMSSCRHQIKDSVAREIIARVQASKGRFLRRIESLTELQEQKVPDGVQAWYPVGEAVALQKVKQAFRDNNKESAESALPTGADGLASYFPRVGASAERQSSSDTDSLARIQTEPQLIQSNSNLAHQMMLLQQQQDIIAKGHQMMNQMAMQQANSTSIGTVGGSMNSGLLSLLPNVASGTNHSFSTNSGPTHFGAAQNNGTGMAEQNDLRLKYMRQLIARSGSNSAFLNQMEDQTSSNLMQQYGAPREIDQLLRSYNTLAFGRGEPSSLGSFASGRQLIQDSLLVGQQAFNSQLVSDPAEACYQDSDTNSILSTTPVSLRQRFLDLNGSTAVDGPSDRKRSAPEDGEPLPKKKRENRQDSS